MSDAPSTREEMELRLRIAPEGISALVRLGWLDPGQHYDPTEVADAVIDFATAALAAGLRPGR